MSDPETDPFELLLRAARLDYGEEKTSLIDEAVRLADLAQDTLLGFQAREALIEAATFGGYPDKALVAFTWCLAQCDKDPKQFDERELLWQYKWVSARLPYFPQIPRAKIEEVHEDMRARYERCGLSLRPVHKIRWLAARRMGEREQALASYEAAERLPRDHGADCDACERNDRIRYLLYVERVEDALEAAQPILSGRMGCAEIPHATLAMILLPLLELDRAEQAIRYHLRGYRLVRGNREFVGSQAEHLEFLGLTGNHSRADRLLEEHLGLAMSVTDLDQRFRFLNAAAAHYAAREGELELALPPWLECYRAEGRYPVAELAAWLEQEAGALADRFDARNGNSLFRDTMTRYRERAALERPPTRITKFHKA